MIVVIMGVAGSGKTTVGTLLSALTGDAFLDADTLHSPANLAKMGAGIPLTDSDRAPWLGGIRERMVAASADNQNLLVACSALKAAYRAFLARGLPVTWVYLKGSADLFRRRLEGRTGHFMKADLLDSQFVALEEPSDVIVIDASLPPREIAERIAQRLKTTRSAR